jgi:predicted outer membrane repeat protein
VLCDVGGGAIFALDSFTTLVDVLFANNTSGYWGGAIMANSDLTCKHTCSLLGLQVGRPSPAGESVTGWDSICSVLQSIASAHDGKS